MEEFQSMHSTRQGQIAKSTTEANVACKHMVVISEEEHYQFCCRILICSSGTGR